MGPIRLRYICSADYIDQSKSPRRTKVRASLQVTPQKAFPTANPPAPVTAVGQGLPSIVQRTEVQPLSAVRAARAHRRLSLAEVEEGKDAWTRWFFRVSYVVLCLGMTQAYSAAREKDGRCLAELMVEETFRTYWSTVSGGECFRYIEERRP